MTKTEIRNFLDNISHDNILKAFNVINENYDSSQSLIRQYVIRHEGKTYPPPETLRIAYEDATGDKLPDTFFANIGEGTEQFKFIRGLGFVLDQVELKFNYYLKKVSNQDVTRTTVINLESMSSFFGLSLVERDDQGVISIKYINDDKIDNNVVIIKKQDLRIFIDRARFKENDILLFSNQGNNLFTLEVIDNYNSKYKYYNSILKNNYLLTNNLFEQSNNMVNDTSSDYSIPPGYPLNQILFGPPGTGKTYSTITKALNIIGLLQKKEIYSKKEYEQAQIKFQSELGKRIEFVTMHQSFSYEDFVQGLKPKPEVGNGISFYYKNGVFKEICRRAEESTLLINRSGTEETFLIDKLFPSFFLSIDEKSVNEILSENKFQGKKITQKNAFEYFNEKLGKKYCKAWRDKFDYVLGEKSPRVGFQPDKFSEGELDEFTGYAKIFEELTPDQRKEKLIEEWILDKPQTISPKNDSNNHVIILDEINRANISRVFGELIALVEKDKRDGKLTVTLPSGDTFSVPSNLYIIGTMNTADKSIALVDIALRRRFKFIPLYPDIESLKTVLKENNFDEKEIERRVNLLINLNKIIRAKKSVDFEIGHSYFMENDTLINILNDQILPLLNEYFMYDLRKVKDIIEQQQNDKEGKKIPKLGINLNRKVWNERGLLEVESVDSLLVQIEADVNSTTTELNSVDSNI